MRCFMGFILLLAIVHIRNHTHPRPYHNDEMGPWQIEELIRSRLRDPDSAQFGRMYVARDGFVCGFVNAKNSFGGYVGDRLYTTDGTHVHIDDAETDVRCRQ